MRVRGITAGFFLLSVSVLAQADDASPGITLIPSFGYQHKQLSFDQQFTDIISKPVNENGRHSHFAVYLPTVNLSLTAAYRKFYAAFKYEQTLTEGSVDVDENRPASQGGQWGLYFLNTPGHQTKVKRIDQSLTVGANVWAGMNVFGGFMEGKTTLTPEPTCSLPLVCSAINLAADLENEGRGEYHQDYTEKGPYIGLSYGWQIADAGTLSASVAYAQMDGQFRDNYITTGNGNQHFNFEGKSVGTSLGLTWTAPLGESSAYFIDLRQQQYVMDGEDNATPDTYFDTVKVHTKETMRGLTMGVQLFF